MHRQGRYSKYIHTDSNKGGFDEQEFQTLKRSDGRIEIAANITIQVN